MDNSGSFAWNRRITLKNNELVNFQQNIATLMLNAPNSDQRRNSNSTATEGLLFVRDALTTAGPTRRDARPEGLGDKRDLGESRVALSIMTAQGAGFTAGFDRKLTRPITCMRV